MSFVLLGILNSQAAAGGGAPAFLSSAPLWLDAADASTITESSGSVSQWNNKGTLENFTQATSASQPTTGVSTQNALNVIEFASDFLVGSTKSQWKFLHDGTNYFMAAVLEVEIGNEAVLFENNRGVVTNPGVFSRLCDNNSDDSLLFVSNGSGSVVNAAQNLGITRGAYSIFTTLADPDDAVAADRAELFLNNNAGQKPNTDTGIPSSSDPSINLEVASANNSSTFKLGELIIVSGTDATETNRQTVVDYLNAKWSVF